MKVGTARWGIEVRFEAGKLCMGIWYPVADCDISDRDRARLKMAGFARNSARKGPVEYISEIRVVRS